MRVRLAANCGALLLLLALVLLLAPSARADPVVRRGRACMAACGGDVFRVGLTGGTGVTGRLLAVAQ